MNRLSIDSAHSVGPSYGRPVFSYFEKKLSPRDNLVLISIVLYAQIIDLVLQEKEKKKHHFQP